MEMVEVTDCPTPAYYHLIENDLNPVPGRYEIGRGMNSVLNTAYLPFNHFDFLANLAKSSPNKKLRVLEGGCGVAKSLRDLKRGLGFEFDTSLNRSNEPANISPWLQQLDRQKLPGLGDRVYTVGVTLTRAHAELAFLDEPSDPDKIVVGTMADYSAKTDERFDLVFDPFGVGFHTPLEAAGSYGRLLAGDGLGIMRVVDGWPEDLSTIIGSMKDVGLKVMELAKSPNPEVPLVEIIFSR